MLWCGLLVAIRMRIGLRGDVVICVDMDFCAGFIRVGGGSWGRRSSTTDTYSRDGLGNVYHFRDLALSVLEIVDGDNGILTFVVVVMVDKRVVQLVVRMSNSASAKEDREKD